MNVPQLSGKEKVVQIAKGLFIPGAIMFILGLAQNLSGMNGLAATVTGVIIMAFCLIAMRKPAYILLLIGC